MVKSETSQKHRVSVTSLFLSPTYSVLLVEQDNPICRDRLYIIRTSTPYLPIGCTSKGTRTQEKNKIFVTGKPTAPIIDATEREHTFIVPKLKLPGEDPLRQKTL